MILATLAAEAAGVAAPVNAALNTAHVRELLQRLGAPILVAAGPELDETVRAAAVELARGGAVRALLALRPTGASGTAPLLPSIGDVVVDYLSERAEAFPGERFPGTAPAADDIAAVFHAGGMTGLPKLAAHTHTNEVSDAWMVGANSALDEDSVVLTALPLFHVNALVVTLLAPLLRGQKVVWVGPLGYRDITLFNEFWRMVEHHRIATMSAVPTVCAVLPSAPSTVPTSARCAARLPAPPRCPRGYAPTSSR